MFLFIIFSTFSFIKSLLPFFPLAIWFYEQQERSFCFFTSACWFKLPPVLDLSLKKKKKKWWASKKQPLSHSMIMRIKCSNAYKALLQSRFIFKMPTGHSQCSINISCLFSPSLFVPATKGNTIYSKKTSLG